MAEPDTERIADSVGAFFRAIETGSWATAHSLLTDPVQIAHGDDQTTMTSNELTSSWRRSHTGFDATRYRVRLVEVGLTGEDQAIARFDAHITLVPSEARQDRPVEIPGRYTIGLRRSTGHWTIHSIRHDQT
jgi:hypothetical protein